MATRLSISEAAVKQHLGHLYDKFEIYGEGDRRRVRLANEALRRGAVSLADVRAAGE
jgi:DNA-binding CsgD family transcriptional regulator